MKFAPLFYFGGLTAWIVILWIGNDIYSGKDFSYGIYLDFIVAILSLLSSIHFILFFKRFKKNKELLKYLKS